MEIVNKYFKRKLGNDIPTKVINVEGGFAIFENGARCKVDTLLSDFEQSTSVIIQEQKINAPVNTELNPDTFFDAPLQDPGLLNQLEMLVKNPDLQLKRTIEDIPSVDLTENKIIGKVSMDGDVQPPASMMKNVQSNSAKDAFASRLEGNEGVNMNSNQNYPQANPKNEPAEYEVFNNVKLTDELEITIPITIKVPKAHKVDVLNDMFKTSFVEFLADREVSSILSDKKAFMGLIMDQLDEWLDTELGNKSRKKTKKKPTKKVSRLIKKNVIDIIVKPTVEASEIKIEIQPTTNGIPTEIKNDEDLEKIKAHVAYLLTLPESPKTEQDLLKFDEMAAIYLATK